MIKVGDSLPNATFTVMTADGPKPRATDEIFKGKKVVLFGVPGAFTPTCHRNHLPSYRDKAAEFKAKGVDTIAVMAVNDVFVMGAWADASASKDKIEFLADGSAAFSKETGLDLDLTANTHSSSDVHDLKFSRVIPRDKDDLLPREALYRVFR